MAKTLTLYPAYFKKQDSSSDGEDNFYRILSSNGTGKAAHKAANNSTVGVIAFDMSPLRRLSTACQITGYGLAYQQKCNINVWAKQYWINSPLKLTNVSITGQTLNSFSEASYGSGFRTDTTGNDYLNKSGTFFNTTQDGTGLFENGSAYLAFRLGWHNDQGGNFKTWMRNLRASVTYEPKYYAKFYDDDGTLLDTQTVDGGQAATEPSLTKEGFTTQWLCNGKKYLGYELPTSESSDLTFTADYVPISRIVGVFVPSKGTINVYKNGELQMPSYNSNNINYYSVLWGDTVNAEAVGCNATSEDLSVEVMNLIGEPTETYTIDGGTETTLDVFSEASYTDNTLLRVTPKTVYYQVTTSVGDGGGTITASHLVERHSNDAVTITPDVGIKLTGVLIDEEPLTDINPSGMVIQLQNITADVVIEAEFTAVMYEITFDTDEGIVVTGPQSVSYGMSGTWTLGCGNDASLTSLSVDDGESVLGNVFKQISEYEFTLDFVDAPHTIHVRSTDDLVTITLEQSSGGTVTSETMDTGSVKFINGGGVLSFLATPNDGFAFKGWDDSTTNNPLSFTPTSDRTVKGTFEEGEQKIYVSIRTHKPYFYDASSQDKAFTVPGGGDIIYQGVSRAHFLKVVASATDTTHIEFQAKDGFHLTDEWGGHIARALYYSTSTPSGPSSIIKSEYVDVGDDPEFDLYEPNAKNIQVEIFSARDLIPLVWDIPDGCFVTVEEESPVGGFTQYHYESVINLTATAADGWYFDHWTDGNRNATREYKVGLEPFNAVFKKHTFLVNTETNEGGTISAPQYVPFDEDFLITITTNYGKKIKDVLVDGVSVIDNVTMTRRGGTYLLKNVKTVHKVEAVFESRMYQGHRLLDYYPPVIASIREIEKLMEVLQVTDDALWDSMSFVMENQFIDSATVEGVTMWERELGIVPSPTDTMAQRKARLRLKWVPNNRFTLKWLHEWLEDVCGTSIQKPVVHVKDDYILTVVLPWFVQWVEVFKDIEKYKPANIQLDPTVQLPSKDINLYMGFAMGIHHEYTVNGHEGG